MVDMLELSDAEFDELVHGESCPVLVDFWAPWCGPCLHLAPILEEVAAELSDKIKVMKLNTDDNPASPGRFGVMSIPTLILFSEGEEITRLVGTMPKTELIRKINDALAD